MGRVVLCSLRRGVRPPRLWCEMSVAVLWAIVAVRSTEGLPWWWLPVPALLGWLAVLLAVCDLAASRLPDALTLPAYPAAALTLTWVGYWSRAPDLAGAAVVGGALFAGTYAAARWISPGAIGPGDVKLAGSLGALVGAVSVATVVLCMIAAAILTVVRCALTRRASVPHGPAMLAPAWLATVLAPGWVAGTGR